MHAFSGKYNTSGSSTQTDIRKNLSTYNSMAIMYHDLADWHPNSQQLRAVLAVDIKMAFDTVPYEGFVSSMFEQGLDGKQLDFVR